MTGLRRWIGIVTLSAAAFVLAHQLVFLLAYGPGFGHALRATGHGSTWDDTVLAVAMLSSALLVAACVELARLARRARALAASGVDVADERAIVLPRLAGSSWAIIAALGTALYVVNENLEHLRDGGTLPGLSVLAGGAVNPLVILLITSLVAALVGALFLWRRAILTARLRAVRVGPRLRPRRQPKLAVRPVDLRPETFIGRNLAGRAPPRLLAL